MFFLKIFCSNKRYITCKHVWYTLRLHIYNLHSMCIDGCYNKNNNKQHTHKKKISYSSFASFIGSNSFEIKCESILNVQA